MQNSRPLWRRITVDSGWIAFTVILGLFFSYFSAADKQNWNWPANAWVWLVSVVVGLVLGERRRIWRWTVSVIRAARILVQEDDNPTDFILPYVEVDFWPQRTSGTGLEYIHLQIQWLSLLHRKVTIEDITGDFSIDGYPIDEFSQRVRLELTQHGWTESDSPIRVSLKNNLQAVLKMRQDGRGKGSLVVNLSFRLNGELVTMKTKNDRYCYAD
jgi:hypothetical protein